MFNLRNIFELVIDDFNNGPSSQHNFVGKHHQSIFHVLSDPSNQFQALLKKFFKQGLRNVTFVTKHFNEKTFAQGWHRSPIIDIA